jgi:hypothetical protein
MLIEPVSMLDEVGGAVLELWSDSDRFLAVSGLARIFAQEFHEDYLAGLWKKDLVHELLWYRCETPTGPEDGQANSCEYLGRIACSNDTN